VRAEAVDVASDQTLVLSADHRAKPNALAGTVWVVGIVVVSLALKAWFDLGPLGTTDSDEATAGLMARHLLHGEVSLFYWGQHYGGALEPWLLVPTFRLFGASVFTLRVPTLLLGIASTVLVWRIGRRLYTPRQAIAATAAFAVVPLPLVWFSAREMFFYVPTVTLGLVAVLVALRIVDKPESWRWWAMLGLATGVGWWLGPSIIYFALPVVIWLASKGAWRHWRGVLVAGATTVVGALPWVVENIRHDLASFDATNFPHTTTYFDRFRFFLTHGVPFLLGLRLPYIADWVLAPWLTKVIAVALVALLGLAVIVAVRRWSIDGVLAVCAPFLYAAFPMNGDLGQGRYLYYLTPVLALLIGRICTRWSVVVALGGIALVLAVAFLNKTSAMQAIVERPDTGPISAELDRQGYRYAFAEYWVAYQMDFEDGERITATSFGPVRYQPYDAEVRSHFAVFVFRTDPGWVESEQQFLDALASRQIAYRLVRAGRYEAVIPAVAVQP
jgi:4-amino-4-deoxy-L-arabinose transferase-like glycosyltransferase